jgi:hypothetical protein
MSLTAYINQFLFSTYYFLIDPSSQYYHIQAFNPEPMQPNKRQMAYFIPRAILLHIPVENKKA